MGSVCLVTEPTEPPCRAFAFANLDEPDTVVLAVMVPSFISLHLPRIQQYPQTARGRLAHSHLVLTSIPMGQSR